VRCFPYVEETDAPCWVIKYFFFKNFDQNDFLCRHIKNVDDAYLADWFHNGSHQTRFFKIPPVPVHNRKTQFISGRHRTAVLLRHLERVPLAFAMRNIGDADKAWIESVADAPIETEALIDLPDLPIVASLP